MPDKLWGLLFAFLGSVNIACGIAGYMQDNPIWVVASAFGAGIFCITTAIIISR